MDDARCVGPAPATQSYLNIDAVIAAAASMQADAVHPGYGFLSERAAFAQAVADAGMTFVGPTPEAMAAMGSKIEAKRRVREFDVPVVPGYDGDDQSPQRCARKPSASAFRLLIKASAGGGGRGMRVVNALAEFDEALDAAKREALAAFGDDAVLLERYLRDPRHIEFQILGRRARHHHSSGRARVFDSAPPSEDRRGSSVGRALAGVARRDGRGGGARGEVGNYVNAGTCEFMLDADGSFYFLEMNARLQVEHPVTELVYGIDLVRWQLRIADGERLTIAQEDVRPRGWAIEARIYAEDPANHMLPSTGTIARWSPPEGPGVRLDSGVAAGSEVSLYYDPMLAKLIVYGTDRLRAIARLEGALEDFTIDGVRTNIPLLLWIARDEAFRDGRNDDEFSGAASRRIDFRQAQARPAKPCLLCVCGACWSTTLRRGASAASACRCASRTPTARSRTSPPMPPCSRAMVSFRRSGRRTARRARYGDTVRATFDGSTISGSVGYERGDIAVHFDGRTHAFRFAEPPAIESAAGAHGAAAGDGRVTAPMPGKIVKVAVARRRRGRRTRVARRSRSHEDGTPHRSIGRRPSKGRPRQRRPDRQRRRAPRGTHMTAPCHPEPCHPERSIAKRCAVEGRAVALQ